MQSLLLPLHKGMLWLDRRVCAAFEFPPAVPDIKRIRGVIGGHAFQPVWLRQPGPYAGQQEASHSAALMIGIDEEMMNEPFRLPYGDEAEHRSFAIEGHLNRLAGRLLQEIGGIE